MSQTRPIDEHSMHTRTCGELRRENVGEEVILAALDELFGRFAKERSAGEHFGDFIARAKVVEPPRRRPAIQY